ncbi:hypothetical protein AB0I54_46105 [Streptomyces sp. NPDC050625]|uniref:hypothetical protein n=1 Tax=Streptomyces sp. NPDC050625 TaxID=3154629 RepID=UPI003424C1F0
MDSTTAFNWIQPGRRPFPTPRKSTWPERSPGRSCTVCGQRITDGRVDKLLNSRFSGPDRLVTLQLSLDITNASEEARHALAFARYRDLRVGHHAGVFGVMEDDQIRFLDDEGGLSPSTVLVHGAR